MNTQLQRLIEELKEMKSECQKNYIECEEEFKDGFARENMAFGICISKLTKILNEGSVAATSKDEHENGFNHIHYPE